MHDPYLLLWLEAPLQAWGHDSKFGRRDTLNFPTKSGVLGLVCCALGAAGEQTELLAEFAPLEQTVLAFVRNAREPLLRDFHMVGSGYDDQNPWQKMLIPKTSEGKPAVGGGSKMTYRYYLQDMAFAVILQVPGVLVSSIAQALQNPVWDLYLGRKNCAPTDFIYRGQFDLAADAQQQALDLARQKQLRHDFTVVGGEAEGEVFTLNDVPVQFGPIKQYRDRRVTRIIGDG